MGRFHYYGVFQLHIEVINNRMTSENTLPLFIFQFSFVGACVCLCVPWKEGCDGGCVMEYGWRSESNLLEFVLSFHHRSSGDGTQVIGLGSKCL